MFTDPYLAASFAAFADHEPEQAFLSVHFYAAAFTNLQFTLYLFLTRYYVIRFAGGHDVQRDCREHAGATSLHEQDLVVVGNFAFWNKRNKSFFLKSTNLLVILIFSIYIESFTCNGIYVYMY